MYLFKRKKLRKGFSLYELLVGVAIMSIIMLPLPSLLKNSMRFTVQSEKQVMDDVYMFYNDLKYDITLATNVAYSTSSITINRLDGCLISYVYDGTSEIDKNVNCPTTVDTGIRTVRVNNINLFNIALDSYGNYTIQLRKDWEDNSIIHEYIVSPL